MMVKSIVILSYLIFVGQVKTTVRHTSDLDWAAGQDVSTHFKELLSKGTIPSLFSNKLPESNPSGRSVSSLFSNTKRLSSGSLKAVMNLDWTIHTGSAEL